MTILHVATGAVVLLQSAQTVMATWHPHGRAGLPAFVLGSVEVAAAILFLVRRTLVLGAIGLLAVFAIGFVVHGLRGQFPLALIVYAAAVYLVMSEGAKA